MKRLFDLGASFFGLILLAPIFVLSALWIMIDSKGPIFFRQERVGFQGSLFRIHKFRTMVLDAEKKRKANNSWRRFTNYYCREFSS